MADDQVPRETADKASLDPIHLIVEAEERLTGLRQNLVQQAWDTAMRAGETADPAALDALIRLHQGVKAIDFALANRPSVYRETAPI